MKHHVKLKSNLMIAFASLALSTAALHAQSRMYGVNYGTIDNLVSVTTTHPASGETDVVAAVANSKGALEVVAWQDPNIDIFTKFLPLVLLGHDSVPDSAISSVAITGLDADRAVTADVDNSGAVSINTWEIAKTGVSLQNGTTTAPDTATAVSIARLSTNEVVLAIRTVGGDLTVESWNISSSGVPTLESSAFAGESSLVAVAATSSSQVVAATRDSAGNQKVIVWAVEKGIVTRKGDDTAGPVEQLSIGAWFGNNRAVTAAVDSSGVVETINWAVSASGSITRSSSAKGAAASQIAATLGSGAPFTAAIGSKGDLDVEQWNGPGVVKPGSNNSTLGISSVAVALEHEGEIGTNLATFFVTASRGSKYHDLKIDIWSVEGPSVLQ
jgi:hypothetical protein